MREKAAANPHQRGSLTGDRLLVNFKLVNALAGYETKFAKSTYRRLGYWRAVLTQGGADIPPLGDDNYPFAIEPRMRRMRGLLTALLKAERAKDVSHIRQRIIYVSPSA